MSEDNFQHNKQVDYELMEKIKKATEKKALLDAAKEEMDEKKTQNNNVNNRSYDSDEKHYDVPAKHYKDKFMDDGVKTNEKEVALERLPIVEKHEKEEQIKQKAEAAKAAYQEMANKVKQEKENREVRLEAQNVNTEISKPNQKGSLLKDIAYIVIVVAVLIGSCSLLMSNIMVSLALTLGAILFGAIVLGLSEIIKLLQQIYDLMYYDKFGKKRQ